jgi:hypothetical protein
MAPGSIRGRLGERMLRDCSAASTGARRFRWVHPLVCGGWARAVSEEFLSVIAWSQGATTWFALTLPAPDL